MIQILFFVLSVFLSLSRTQWTNCLWAFNLYVVVWITSKLSGIGGFLERKTGAWKKGAKGKRDFSRHEKQHEYTHINQKITDARTSHTYKIMKCSFVQTEPSWPRFFPFRLTLLWVAEQILFYAFFKSKSTQINNKREQRQRRVTVELD